MAKAVITILSCKGSKLSFPADRTKVQVPDTFNMPTSVAAKIANRWCDWNRRKMVSFDVDIVYGRDNMDEDIQVVSAPRGM